MSLISDALKRQEQLRAPGTGAAQREVSAVMPSEVSAARPPEASATGSPEVAATKPPEASRGTAAPNLAAPAAQPRADAPRPTSPRQRPNYAAPAAQPHRVSGAPAANPFLERERAAARRPTAPVLLMPVIGLLMLLVLLFLRREFVPSQPLQTVTVKKVESEKRQEDNSEGLGIIPAETPIDNLADAAVVSDLFPAEAKSKKVDAESLGGPGIVPAETPVDVPKAKPSAATEPNQLSTSNSLSASSASAPLRENPPQPEPTNRQTDEPSNQAVEAPPQQPAWPAFTLTGIAVGRERIAVLSTGEMLLAGETSKCGVKVKKVNASSVVFAWSGETKTLRKGEHSDKPAD